MTLDLVQDQQHQLGESKQEGPNESWEAHKIQWAIMCLAEHKRLTSHAIRSI